jgi:endonuclease III
MKIFELLQANNPTPKLELDYTTPFTLLVAIVLSAQATDVGVNKATKALFPVADSPEKMLALGEDGLKQYIKTIGLYNAKAANVMKLSQAIIDGGGEIPDNMGELTKLAGVGNKTARVFLNTLYDAPLIATDTHVGRLSNRLGLTKETNPDKVSLHLEKIVPPKYRQYASHWLVLHGRYICTAKKPKCDECFLANDCPKIL